MEKLRKLNLIYNRILIMLATLASFCFAYFIYANGMLSTNSGGATVLVIFILGSSFYVMFELIIHFCYAGCANKIENFVLPKNDFKTLLRIAFIFRNLILGALNFLFLYNPLISVWGILLSYTIFTTAAVICLYFVVKKLYDIKGREVSYIKRFSLVYTLYMLVYLLVGAII